MRALSKMERRSCKCAVKVVTELVPTELVQSGTPYSGGALLQACCSHSGYCLDQEEYERECPLAASHRRYYNY